MAPNRIRSSKRSNVSVTGIPLTCVPLVESRSFNRYVSPANCNCAWRVETEGLFMIIVLSGARPIEIRSSTSSYVVPLITSFGMLLMQSAENLGFGRAILSLAGQPIDRQDSVGNFPPHGNEED